VFNKLYTLRGAEGPSTSRQEVAVGFHTTSNC